MSNQSEVAYTPEDNNNIRLGGSVNPEPTMGATNSDFAKNTSLDAADTGGVVGIPTIDSGYGMDGSMAPSLNANVDMKNSDTTLMATASTENLSAKYKYPNVSQDVPPKGRPSVSFNDHS